MTLTCLRKEMKTLLHTGHLGMVKTKGRARETLYWPGINNDIEHLTHACDQCIQYLNKQAQESIIPHDIPEMPWTKIGTDLFELDGKNYLIIVDYTTNFYDICEIANKESETVVLHTKQIFAKFGIPKIVV